MALIEAMTLGLPIVASDIPAMREAVGDAGILVPSTDVEALAQSVLKALNSPELLSQMRQGSLQRSSLFSIEAMLKGYKSLFS